MKIRSGKEQGIVLMAALIIGGVVGLTLASYLVWASNHSNVMRRSYAWNDALPVLEAGIEEAMSHLHYSPEKRATNGWKLENGLYAKTRNLGTNAYCYVTITPTSPPVIVSQGFVKAPLQADQYISRTVRVTTTNRPVYGLGFATKLWIDMNGNNVRVDSYDSTDPKYSTFGMYDPRKAKDGGSVASNLGLINTITDGNADIYGKVSTGPGGTVTTGPNGSIGSTAWHNSGKTGIQAGWTSDDMNTDYPSVENAPTSGLKPIGGKVGGAGFQYILGNGTYQVSDLTGSLYVSGDATLVVKDKLLITGTDKILIAPGASLKIYCYAADAKIAGGGVANMALTPVHFEYLGMPSNKSLSYNGSAALSGAIYAPDTDFHMGGNGGFYGASVTKSLKMNGKFSAHFDESLRKVRYIGYVITSWNEI